MFKRGIGTAHKQGKKFRKALPIAELEDMKRRKFASNSYRKYRWAVGLYVDWHKNVIETQGAEMVDSYKAQGYD